ncbi:MAG TPA: protein kinase [Blastocatellia bacterium]|nr:protein kinase [Blastocatellia bacterium]
MGVEAGTRIGHYKILAMLGKGGMGEVYLAQDTKLDRKVALKLLSAGFTQREDRVQRFQQEARAASALNHPNIITIYEIGETDSTHFIATEFIDGETLRQRLNHARMSPREVVELGVQTASALAAAHKAGIMHRDIKPENIMLRNDGYVKVLDFGLAKLTESSAEHEAVSSDPEAVTNIESATVNKRYVDTDPGTVLGTVTYMSPEQARGLQADHRTDIFSLGVVLYEAIAGRVPFEGATVSDVIFSILGKKPPPLSRYSLEVPAELQRIVRKALEKDRDERYQTVKDMLIDLKRLKQQQDLQEELSEADPLEWSAARAVSDSGGRAVARAPSRPSGARTEEITTAVRSASSAEYIITEIKRHKRGVMYTVAALVFVAVGLVVYFKDSRKSVAVLPFASGASDAMTKDLNLLITKRIINRLSRLQGDLKVIPYSSVSRFADQPYDPVDVGRQLGVKTVLTGNVVKREGDDNLSVSVELVNMKDGSLIYSEEYSQKFADLRRLQERMLEELTEKLGLEFTDDEKNQRVAESLYQEGRNYYDKRTADGMRRGIDFFRQAIEINPKHALAYAGLADSYSMLVTYGVESPRAAYPRAIEAAEKAVAMDAKLAEGHTSLAWVRFRTLDWAGAESEFRLALSYNPDYAQAHQWYANYLAAVGKAEEAISEARRAQELDPTSLIVNATVAYVYYNTRRYDEAIEQCRKTLMLDPNFFAARRYLALALAQKGAYAEAIAEAERAVAGSKVSAVVKAEYATTLALAGKRAEAERIIEELKQLSSERYLSPYHIAAVYACLGDKDEAFEWLKKTVDEQGDFLNYAKADPKLTSLRTDPRYGELMRRIGLQ